jgi:hypothetical protein
MHGHSSLRYVDKGEEILLSAGYEGKKYAEGDKSYKPFSRIVSYNEQDALITIVERKMSLAIGRDVQASGEVHAEPQRNRLIDRAPACSAEGGTSGVGVGVGGGGVVAADIVSSTASSIFTSGTTGVCPTTLGFFLGLPRPLFFFKKTSTVSFAAPSRLAFRFPALEAPSLFS